jgi:dTDP-4-amino-4,6-dideoxygalactose transaminase
MTTGEGGMIVFSSNQSERMARLYRNQGMETRYQNEVVGFNLRMTEIQAAIGIHQLKRLPAWTEKRRQNAQLLSSRIDNQLIVTPRTPEGYSHVFHQYTVRIMHSRDEISVDLKSQGIDNAVYYPTQVHKLPSFKSTLKLPNTETATKQVLSLPVNPSLKNSDIHRVADTLNRIAGIYAK